MKVLYIKATSLGGHHPDVRLTNLRIVLTKTQMNGRVESSNHVVNGRHVFPASLEKLSPYLLPQFVPSSPEINVAFLQESNQFSKPCATALVR